MDVALAKAWLDTAADAIAAQADQLTTLDAAIGDSDHGVNMNRGFGAVRTALAGAAPDGVGAVFTLAGSTLVSKVGGASGPLYGSALRALGKSLPEGPEVDAAAFGAGLRAGLEALRKLGGAAPGDKTIVDAYLPAVDAYDAALRQHGGDGDGGLAAAARAAAEAAAEGVRATVPLQARKGRASYLGERSIGHQDPGATSTWLIFQALADATAP
ncbi:dihydroxyacetone kinase subunit DhaL [Catellatospora chokoriensis]|uniref:Dihydroxyacetone kinase subunit L n=1 Tax=Catellatospora chokoriensis TaxID=310353 RepID=A0A8J3KBV9_9ACTN|nr:dihydroxyacetone kinase subunit DhaL [Catellatospora chokoriensis]GIF93109.1 dihydroxyacetone kinase subunit L [Catellatospora chokoriensis]